ncbi:MAG: ABC transporter ATP-binding protein [Rhodospirillales bacterium]
MKDRKKKQRKWPPTIWRIATTVSLRRGMVVMLCLVLSGVLEGVGIASMLPLIAISQENGAPSPAAVGQDAGGKPPVTVSQDADGKSPPAPSQNIGPKPSSLTRMVFSGLDFLGLPHDARFLLIFLVVGMLGKAVLSLIAMRNVGYAVAEVGTKMRLRLVESLLGARWSFFVRQPVGRFANALGMEATRAGEAYNATAEFLAHSIQAVVYVFLAAAISFKLGGAALAIGAIMLVTLNRLLIITRRNAKKQTKRMKSLISRLADVLIGLKPMKAMARQTRFGNLFVRDVREIEAAMRNHVFARHATRLLQEPIIAICLGIGIYISTAIWVTPIGDLVIMCLVLAKTVSTMGKAQQDLQAMQVAQSGFMAIQTAIDDAIEAREVISGTKLPTFEREIELRDVSLSFGEKHVITGANIVIPCGGVTAITGFSGAGKTTFVDILLGLYRPDAGEVRIDGTPLAEIDLQRWRGMIGYVPQELLLYHDTIMINVTLGEPSFSRQDVEAALRQAGAWEFVAALPEGIDHVVGERGALLSGGQRQRIAMARALVHKPKLLILDEATSALDPHTGAMIVRNVCDLARATGLTILSITHQPTWVAAADKVIRVEDGKVTEVTSAPLRASAE